MQADDSTALLPSAMAPWRAELCLRVSRDATGCTNLVHNRHAGPLRVQRLLYPEGPEYAQALLLHPPGGIAGGDQLAIDIHVHSGARLLCTTPGASKWYHGERGSASQHVRLVASEGAVLEWLPQESILYNGAFAKMHTEIELSASARMFGWDIVQLGRVASGECFANGLWSHHLRLTRAGIERWRERSELTAGHPLLQSPLGLAGHAVCATAWACAPALSEGVEDLLSSLRDVAAMHAPVCGISWLPAPVEVLQIRVLSDASDLVRALLEALWATLRPRIAGRPAQRLRIWST